MNNETILSFKELISTSRVFLSMALLFSAWILLGLLKRLSGVLARKFSRHRLLIGSLYPVIRLVVWVSVAAFIVLAIFRPPVNTVLAISASAGLALGLGAQDLIRDVLAGILILFERPFRVGDMIQVGNHYGEVLDIGIRSIHLQTFDDSVVTLPNAQVLHQAVSNSNTGELSEMVVVPFSLPATVDPDVIKQLAWEAAACSPYVYLKKPVSVVVEDHFDRIFLSKFRVKAYVLDIRLERLFASDVLERIKREVLDRGILTDEILLALNRTS